MGSGALHADRWCLPVAVLCNWPGLIPASLGAPDNPASLPSCPAHTNHPGGEQMWPCATQRGVSQWWGDTIPVFLQVMNTSHSELLLWKCLCLTFCFRGSCLCCCVWLQVYWNVSCHAAQRLGGFSWHSATAASTQRLQGSQQASQALKV